MLRMNKHLNEMITKIHELTEIIGKMISKFIGKHKFIVIIIDPDDATTISSAANLPMEAQIGIIKALSKRNAKTYKTIKTDKNQKP